MPSKRKSQDVDSDGEYEYDDAEEDYNDHHIGRKQRGKQSVNSGVKGNRRSDGSSIPDFGDDNVKFQDYSRSLSLKPDHERRPIWITKDNLIYLEAFSPLYKQAYDFLVAIAEPESRPEFIHCYKLTENSLYAAVAVSIDTESIITVLSRLCKTDVPQEVVNYIRACTYTFGKAKIVLKDNNFYIESRYADILRELLRNPIIRDARVQVDQAATAGGMSIYSSSFKDSISSRADAGGAGGAEVGAGATGTLNAALAGGVSSAAFSKDTSSTNTGTVSGATGHPDAFLENDAPVEDARNLDYRKLGVEAMDEDDDDDLEQELMASAGSGTSPRNRSKMQTVSFMIARDLVQLVKRSAKEESHYPLMEEYDFKNDRRNPLLSIDLRPSTRIRPYQEKSLSKMFGNGRARSGIIVLPCGAGKSLTGVTAASTVKRSCIIMCINNESVKQWKEQFVVWTNVSERSIRLFTSGSKEVLPPPTEACIVITTYSMICHGGRRSESGEKMIQSVSSREWGLMILDEVHVAPADMFQKVVHMVNAHCKLGLTATLVREDNKIQDLSFLVGPKLYEANWIDLTNDGYLAKVQCVEVWCPMTKEFYAEYIRRSLGGSSRLQRLLYTLNPRKFRACEYLVRYHSERGDKIIIFSDDVPALVLYCEALKAVKEVPYIYGGTKDMDRRDILTAFKTRTELSCIGLSKVGDTALDIPEANVIIQVSSHFGARRQEAQRLGRILRPKPNPTGSFNAFFYTLISTDTKEMYFSSKRQQYLIDQGYTFKVVQDLADVADRESVLLRSVAQEVDLLNKVISFNYQSYDSVEDREVSRRNQGEVDNDDGDGYDYGNSGSGGAAGEGVRRRAGVMSSISGAGETVYTEFSTSR